jgi:beta-mannosidase
MVRLVLVLFFVVASAATRMDLSYPTWKVHNSNSSVSCKATVPGVVHTDLIGCGLISEPYEGFNDILQRWVAKENWTYSTSFSISAELLEHLNVRLVADGIDTVSSIRVNGHLVGSTDNMFLR